MSKMRRLAGKCEQSRARKQAGGLSIYHSVQSAGYDLLHCGRSSVRYCTRYYSSS